MGMVKLDPSQNPNLLTDYDKTLHNWLCPQDEHITQNSYKSVKRGHLWHRWVRSLQYMEF